jgi:hypothetical protein
VSASEPPPRTPENSAPKHSARASRPTAAVRWAPLGATALCLLLTGWPHSPTRLRPQRLLSNRYWRVVVFSFAHFRDFPRLTCWNFSVPSLGAGAKA